MKTIERSLPWTECTQWAWPEEDEKLVQVFDHVSDIDIFMRHIENPIVCVQAGGAAGIWPLRYAMFFERVYTFEPMTENREALQKNIAGADNITVSECALSNEVRQGRMVFDRSEHNNYGAVYFQEGDGEVKTTTIDSLDLERCDFIQLDIEGHELEALLGAAETIANYKPTIVLEEKPLPQLIRDYKEPRKLLESMGYREVGRIHKDVIFQC